MKYVVLLLILSIPFLSVEAYLSVPPTGSFKMINMTGGNVTAQFTNSFVEFKNGSGISITPNYTLNEITFTATGGGGINNTISSIGTQQSIVSGQVLIDHQLKGIACGGDLICSNNATDVTISFTETGIGSIALDDLTDVIITTPAYLSTLFYNGVEWIDKIFTVNSVTCGAGQFVNLINNQTGVTSCATPSGSGNATVLDDLGYVTITSPAYPSFLFWNSDQWVDRIFSVNNQTSTKGNFITGINNQSGVTTTQILKVNTFDIDCTDSQQINRLQYNNQTGIYTGTCETDETGGATARESLVASWEFDVTKTNIGTTYIDVYTTANSNGEGIRIDTAGKTTVTLNIMWTKAGSGTQKCQIVDIASATNVLILDADAVSGENTNATQNIPAGLANTIKTYKPQCRSSTSGDDPVWLSGQVLLR